MSYPIQGNKFAFFHPVMAEAHGDTRPACAVDIGASSGDHGDYVCTRQCVIKRFLFHVTIEAVSGTSAAPTVVFKKYSAYGVTSGAVTLATLTIPTGTAIGKTVYKDITPYVLKPGEAIHISWTIGTGTPTGIGDVDWMCEADPENAGNQSNLIASA